LDFLKRAGCSAICFAIYPQQLYALFIWALRHMP